MSQLKSKTVFLTFDDVIKNNDVIKVLMTNLCSLYVW